jgi:hypothetical protein
VFKNSHWCFIVRQKASMSEFEKLTSVCARTRHRRPPAVSSSTLAVKFSTPPSTIQIGVAWAPVSFLALAFRTASILENGLPDQGSGPAVVRLRTGHQYRLPVVVEVRVRLPRLPSLDHTK